MDSLEQRIEDRLWPDPEPEGRAWRLLLIVARYAYAIARDLGRGELSLRAMSLVFTTVLSIAPVLAFSFSVLKGFGFHRQLEPFLLRMLAPIGERAEEVTNNIIAFVDNISGSTLASLSIALLLITVLSMVQKVESSFNYVWRVDRPRNLVRRFSDYLSVMLIGPLLMFAAMGLLATLSSTTAVERLRSMEPFGQTIVLAGELAPFLMVVAAFTFLYVFVPNTKVRFVPALTGGVLAGVTWAFGGSLFTSFVASASRWVVIYSGFAIVIVAMMWLYLSWLILLLGSQFAFYVQNPAYLRAAGPGTAPLSNAVREQLVLAVMLLVGRDFSEPSHGWRTESLAAAIGVPTHALEPITAALIDAGLMTRTLENRLMPARDPRRIGIDEIIAAVRGAPATRLSHAPWGDVASGIAATIDAAVHGAARDRTLADLVDEEARLRAAASPPENDGSQAGRVGVQSVS